MNRIFIGIFLVAVLLSPAGNGYAQIRITAPKDGSTVSRETIVTGTASIPKGHHLWILARRNDFEPLWWPQREAKIDDKTGEWRATVAFGGPQDIGWEFNIGVITVNNAGHTILMNYWKKAMKSGDWRLVEIPKVSSPPKILKVTKMSH